MDITQKKLIKTSDGWQVDFLVTLTENEFSKIKLEDKNVLSEYFKGYSFDFHENNVLISRIFFRMEPWEDETPEEMVQSILKEIKDLFRKLIN
ncbi:efflux RND transporter permease subunit [Methanobacterium alcaliphilum]|uniref:efflux RND transporter permease subunit n=1 Tax=Methanobacterium alcaliphilum TaxID=392018 RepID=UPI00200B5DC9|nr:efflux RND transporter permease subunit [Methanobacterium alcaliphilum]MCK9151208.1 efflux RND transporter permease subunit [Methanobacterium alcaliphilum]